jgi:hypothetical protein
MEQSLFQSPLLNNIIILSATKTRMYIVGLGWPKLSEG